MLTNDMEYNVKQYPNAPYIQRSTSAPAIAENGSETMLPTTYNFKDDQESSNPSRRNPRVSNSKIFDEGSQGGANQLAIMSDPGLLSLINESLPRTPMDLIQADFPSTPSAVYSNRIFDGLDGVPSDLPDSGDLKGSSGDLRKPDNAKRTSSTNLSMLSGNGGVGSDASNQLALEQATKSLDQMYVSPDLSNPKASQGQQGNTPLLSQYHTNLHSTSNNARSSSSFFSSSNPSSSSSAVANSAGSAVLNGSANVLSAVSNKQSATEGLLASSSVLSLNNGFSTSKSNSAAIGAPYNSLLGSNSNPILNPNSLVMNGGMLGMNTLNGGGNSTSSMQQPGLQQAPSALLQQQQPQNAQPAYYVQQAVYLDQNGQPMYYRPAQDFMYPSGMDASGMGGSDRLGGYYDSMSMPQYSGAQGLSAGYWAPNQADQAQMQAAGLPMSMYMNNQQTMGGVGINPANDINRRMIYNPATGQYNSVPANNLLVGPNAQQSIQQGGGRGVAQGQQMLSAGQYPSMVQGGQNPGMNGLPALLPRGGQAMNGGLGGGLMDESMFLLSPHGAREEDMGLSGGMRMMSGHGFGDFNGPSNHHRDRGGRDSNYRDNNKQLNDRGDGSNNRGNNHRDRDSRNNNNSNNSSRGSSFNGSASVSANPARDSLVEEFRNTYGKSRQWGLRDLVGHAVAFCQDQHGSRFIQQRLEVCADGDKQLVFDEIVPAAQSLVTDVFGNYVLQKLFEYGTPDQCEALAILLKGQAVQLAMQMYGCRVVQKALEYVDTPRLLEMVSEFENPQLLLRCVHDSNGNHVVQKCIEIVSKVAREAATPEASDYLSQRIQFIIDAFQGRVKELSSHPYGCRVVQRILEHCSNHQKSAVLEELRQCCTELVQDCYGNYVIQFVMQHGWEADRAVLIREVQANLLDFSQHKFASNVVEKCLQFASKKDRDEMIWTIINVTFDLKSPVDAKGHCVLESMVRDPYANYVVQKVIDVSDERQRAAIMRYVKENIAQLRRYTYGKHIIVRLEKITNEKF